MFYMTKKLFFLTLISFSATVSANDTVNIKPQITHDVTIGFPRCHFDIYYYKSVLKNVCNIKHWSNNVVDMGYDLKFGQLEDRDGNFKEFTQQQREYKQIECFRKMCNI